MIGILVGSLGGEEERAKSRGVAVEVGQGAGGKVEGAGEGDAEGGKRGAVEDKVLLGVL